MRAESLSLNSNFQHELLSLLASVNSKLDILSQNMERGFSRQMDFTESQRRAERATTRTSTTVKKHEDVKSPDACKMRQGASSEFTVDVEGNSPSTAISRGDNKRPTKLIFRQPPSIVDDTEETTFGNSAKSGGSGTAPNVVAESFPTGSNYNQRPMSIAVETNFSSIQPDGNLTFNSGLAEMFGNGHVNAPNVVDRTFTTESSVMTEFWTSQECVQHRPAGEACRCDPCSTSEPDSPASPSHPIFDERPNKVSKVHSVIPMEKSRPNSTPPRFNNWAGKAPSLDSMLRHTRLTNGKQRRHTTGGTIIPSLKASSSKISPGQRQSVEYKHAKTYDATVGKCSNSENASENSNRKIVAGEVVDDTFHVRTYSSGEPFTSIQSACGSFCSDRRNTRVSRIEADDSSKFRLFKFLPKTRFSTALSAFLENLQAPSQRQGWDIVHGSVFSTCCSVVILLNAFFIGYYLNCMVNSLNGEIPPWLDDMDTVFTIFFVLELILRLVVERALFFCGRERKWNMFDSFLVLESIVCLLLNGLVANLTLLRIVRSMRFFRLLRLTRVIRKLNSLRLLLMGIMDSMSSLFWCFIVIGLAIYVTAVLIVSVAADSMINSDPEGLRRWFGGVPKAMETLFMVISGGMDWDQVTHKLSKVNPILELMFVTFIFVMHFGILNVVVAGFVAHASETASKDREALVSIELRKVQGEVTRIKEFFREADLDKSGTLSWNEFSQHLQHRKVKAYFQALDLDVSQAHIIFDLLDIGNHDSVTIDEFVDGCLRLKGQARSIDLNLLIFQSRRVFDRILSFAENLECRLLPIEEALSELNGLNWSLE